MGYARFVARLKDGIAVADMRFAVGVMRPGDLGAVADDDSIVAIDIAGRLETLTKLLNGTKKLSSVKMNDGKNIMLATATIRNTLRYATLKSHNFR